MIKQLFILCILFIGNVCALNAQTFPFIREWGTYYGNLATMKDAVVDSSGNIYIASSINVVASIDNYTTPNAHQVIPGGGTDVLITKFSPEGAVIWSTYYGGELDESPNFLTLDENNNLYVAGETNSSTNIATVNAYQTVKITSANEIEVNKAGFLAKFSSNGTLLYGTYYDGEKNDIIHAVIVKDNVIYIMGSTDSTTNISTPGSYQPNFTGTHPQQEYTFLVKFNEQGERLWGTYYGHDWDNGFAGSGVICIDDDDNIYLSGITTETGNNENYYASSSGVYQPQNVGNIDLYITKFNTLGNRVWSTYFGDNLLDVAMDIIYHDSHIFLSGYSYSRHLSIGENVHQTGRKGSFDDFLLKMDTNGQPVWATYFGGENDTTDDATNTRLSPGLNGSVWMAGLTTDEAYIATDGSYQTSLNNGSNTQTSDAYIAKFNTNGMLVFASYYGGELAETTISKVLPMPNESGFYITGTTKSTTGIATEGAVQSTLPETDGTERITLFLGKFILESLGVNPHFSIALKLHPNPAQGQITIVSDKSLFIKLNLYNAQGRLVHEIGTVHTNQRINLPKVSAGHYFLIATVADTLEQQTFKLLIYN